MTTRNLICLTHFNPLLSTCGLNPSNDTTVESLHTWLLGGEKYIWNLTTKGWTAKEDELFATCLQSSSVDGLTMNPPRASSDDVFCLWKASGALGALLWIPEIWDMDTYLVDLQIALDNYLDIWAQIDPTRIITKSKLHVLLYLVPDIWRFGPSILYSTEVYECWNKIFRGCSILSNYLAPSYDIAITLGDMERFKHQVSGGYWKDNNGKWIRAGSAIRDFLLTNTELQRYLGWVDNEHIKPGCSKSSAASAIVRAAFVVVEDFMVLKEKDDFFDMPVMLDS
ncbi:hypothetical protein BT96DRAFT_934572 [Gymnopus androsaceus JB14]|uniref:Uncharacterized protein n=1 Tax=Gymnopus androsaceus JB14 TaxID=1447944 RepID=A0A6A4I7H8_9AGAR|nr:hypothetical protein BT96DRAFT_934572 [Gymnopus androsaceus JB14]